MIHHNNDNNAYFSAVNAQKFEAKEQYIQYIYEHSYTQETYILIHI